VLLGLFAYFHRTPSWHIVFLPAFLALSILLVVGIGLWFAALTTRYRDVIFIAPFLTQAWQFLTPVIYPASLAHGHRGLLELNPMTAVVAGFRWSLLGLPFGSSLALETSIPIALGLTVSGLFVFRRAERQMADML
jgi:lipopolysaccharide transport system permease protein